MELFDHQKEIINQDPNHALIAMGGGSGKTRTCLELAKGKTIVICPKQQRDDRTWERNAEQFGIDVDLKVISKEEFRRDYKKLERCDTLIVDEVHTMLGVLPDTRYRNKVKVPRTSQLFEALLNYVTYHRPIRMYLVSATPVSKPMHLWAIATLFGHNWDFFKFREKYYIERIMGLRTIYVPNNSTALKQRLADITKQFGYTGQLQDWFEVPEQKHETIYVELTKDQEEEIERLEAEDADPMGKRAKIRAVENGVKYTIEGDEISEREIRIQRRTVYYNSEKFQKIENILLGYSKGIIFASYTGQIHAIEVFLRKRFPGTEIFTLTGKTGSEDRKTIMERAESSERCILIVQSSISAGWELKSCRCMIFASKSYRYVDYKQALWRNLRADNLDIAYNTYYHLVVKGGMDEACHKTILAGEDFQERVMEKI